MLQTTLKPKECQGCGSMFQPRASFARACSQRCAMKVINADKAAKKAAAKAEKAADRAKLADMRPIRKSVSEAQDAFNAFIRARDADLPCISCGETNPPMTPGGQWDAGHFKGRGAFPELRFDEDNCHKQCKACNGGSKHPGKARTVAANYEQRLIARIGAERVARLNGPHELLKLDRDTLRQIKVIYRAKTRQLLKERA